MEHGIIPLVNFTCPVDGYYKVHATVTMLSTSTINLDVTLIKNTGIVVILLFCGAGGGTKQTSNAYCTLCAAGDQLWLRANSAFIGNGSATGGFSSLNIELL
jgi:hypothetical protein